MNLNAVSTITDTNAATLNITGGSVVLVAGTGGIDTDVNATVSVSADADGAAGNTVDLTSTAGGLPLAAIDTDAGTISLSSAGGITRSSGTITGTSLSIAAGGDVGSALGSLSTDVDTFSTTTAIAGDLYVSEASALTIGTVASTAGAVVLDLGGALTDGNAAAVNVTGQSLTITGGNAVTDIETAVSALTLQTAATSITNTGDVTLMDSTVTGQFDLTIGSVLTMEHLNAASQTVNIGVTGSIADGNAATVNITADTVTITATGDVDDIETVVANLTIDADDASINNTGTLELEDSDLGGQFDLSNDGVTMLNAVTADAVNLTSTGALTDGNGAEANVTADTLTISGNAAVDGIETAVGSLTLNTGDASISNSTALTLRDSTLSGSLDLANLNGDVVVGDVSVSGTLAINSGGDILDGNAGTVNITSVLGSSLQSSGTIGSLADAIEVNVGGTLSVLAGGTDGFLVSANIDGVTANNEVLVQEPTVGLVLLGSPTEAFSAHIVGGTGAHQVLGAIGGDLTLFNHHGDWTTLFQFEGTSVDLYSTDSVLREIQYGSAGEAPIIEVEDIVTSPVSSLDFDTWLDDRMKAALQDLATGGK